MKRLAICLLLAGCSGSGSNAPEERWTGHIVSVQSPAFRADTPIPKKHAARDEGENVSPLLTWSNPPDKVEEWALICEERDDSGGSRVHWVIYGIIADAKGLPEGVTHDEELSRPAGARQGDNSWGDTGYGGPKPSKGDPPHKYRFIVYALKKKLDLPPGATAGELREAMKGLVIGRGEIAGTYQR
ncbi:MAG: phospholipid-binding protein PBP [Planctomycetota bacterium]|nr:MAG: phospholipid-binding protein PBP [Planctomycetota bacterium]